MAKHFLTLLDISKQELEVLLTVTAKIKSKPIRFSKAMSQKSLLMIFAKPSLRTRISFEVGMTQMGGSGIYYDILTSPMGKKETIADTAKTTSRYVDIIMARLFEHKDIEELANYSEVPVINGLTNFSHPCQIASDLFTIWEKKGKLSGLKLAYLGDANNNVTHSLLLGCSKMGINISIGCPGETQFLPLKDVVESAKKIAQENNVAIEVTDDPVKAVQDADIVYTDSWMSYHIPEKEQNKRIKTLKNYQVNKELMQKAKPDAVFMNCLPAMRGMEQTADVIDSHQSIVFDQAENRLHMQKAIMLWLIGKV